MEKNKNASKILIALVSAFFVIGMVLATLYDFEISAFLTHLKEDESSLSVTLSVPALIIEVAGKWPSAVLAAFCAAIIMRALLNKKTPVRYAVSAGLVLAAFLLVYNACTASVKAANFLATDKYTFSASDLIVAIPLTIIASIAVIIVALMLSRKTADRLLVPAIVCGAMLACLFIGTEALQLFWGRASLRSLFEAADISGFTPWFVPNGISGGAAFPCDQAASAVALALIPLFYSEKLKKQNPLLPLLTYVAVGLWAFASSLAQICAGACYLSDVLFGAALAFVAVMLGHFFMNKIKNA